MQPPKGQPPGAFRPDRAAPRNDHRAAFERGTTVEAAEDQMVRAAALQEAVEALRIHFEQYFLGLVRQPPNQERDAIRSAILQLKSSFIRNTAVKFRVHSLHNRYLSYERMWDRTLREIEAGTYRRDLFKAKLHRKDAAEVARATREATRRATGGAADDFDVDEAPADETTPGPRAADPDRTPGPGAVPESTPGPRVAPAPRPAPAAARPAAGPAPVDPGRAVGLGDDKLRAVHAAYVEARRRCSEPTEGITFEAVASALRKQVPELLRKHGAKTVEFQVVIRGGKAVLKAVPR